MMNVRFIWLICLLGVGNLWFVDGYECDAPLNADYNCIYQETYDKRYTCDVKPIIKIADKDVNIVNFDGDADNISNLSQSMFPVCQRFQNLEEINIKNIKFVDGDFLYFCGNLNVLDIQDTEIEEISEDFLKPTPLLTKLNIQGNKLTTLLENIFVNQQELVELVLPENQISSLPPKIFNPLKKLRDLGLHKNKIESLNPKWFEKLPNLETLDLSQNEIEKLPKNVFSSLKNLENLMLKFNKLTVINSESFGTLPKLTQLDFFANEIDAIDEKFIDNTKITKINMIGNVCSQDDVDETADKHDGREEYDRFPVVPKSHCGVRECLKKCFENFNSKFN